MAIGYYELSGVTVAAGAMTLTATHVAAPGGTPEAVDLVNLVGAEGTEGTPTGFAIIGPDGGTGLAKHAITATTLALAAPWGAGAITGGTALLNLGINALPIGRQAALIREMFVLSPLLKSNALVEFLGDTAAQIEARANLGLGSMSVEDAADYAKATQMAAMMLEIPDYNGSTEYDEGVLVKHDGSFFVSLVPVANEPPPSLKWKMVLGPGSRLLAPASTVSGEGFSFGGNGVKPTSPGEGAFWRVANNFFVNLGGFDVRMPLTNTFDWYPAGAEIGLVETPGATYAAYTGAGSVIPLTDTVPLATAGQLVASVSATMKDAAHRAKVIGSVSVATSAAQWVTLALFRGTTCIGVRAKWLSAAGNVDDLTVRSRLITPGAGAQTYSLRVGQASGSTTLYVNGGSGGRLFGGSMDAVIEVEEHR